MKIVVFGLTVRSSWGNGHATLWRGLCRSLARLGHLVEFFERDVSYYETTRDLDEITDGVLTVYDDWDAVLPRLRTAVRSADAAIVTSYCPDGVAATELVCEACRGLAIFYDLDTPVTLSRLSRGESVPYIGSRQLRDFDLVLSYTGGKALDELRTRLGARRVAPLYGHVDPQVHQCADPVSRYRCDLSYLGTYAADRQPILEEMFVAAARKCPDKQFLIGGAQYPSDFPWAPNIYFVRHLPPSEHAPFFSSSRLTLNVTRPDMAEMGWCPSGRLFEATACGAPVITDVWDGLGAFFEPGEIIAARSTEDVIDALDMDEAEIRRVAVGGRERTRTDHTADRRAAQLVEIIAQVDSGDGKQPDCLGCRAKVATHLPPNVSDAVDHSGNEIVAQ